MYIEPGGGGGILSVKTQASASSSWKERILV